MRRRVLLSVTGAGLALVAAACSSSAPSTQPAHSSASSATAATKTTAPPTTSSPAPTRSAHPRARSTTPSRTRTSTPPSRASSTHGTTGGASTLPLSFGTHDATQVITVTAGSAGDTTATLQAWSKSGSHWRHYGGSVEAHLGSDGLSRHPSESRSATPIGTFTLTQAFGHDGDPGTSLPYTHTTPADWWISQSGPQYNTRQRCSSGCSFNRGDPNEHLYYETPFYNYAVVIDYNTRNAPGGVHQGAGSAFFLHVTDGNPTAGCVSIPQDRLVHLMRWLDPSRHPRILIGVG